MVKVFPEIKYSEKELLGRINSTTAADMDRALCAGETSFNDFLSLISPLAGEQYMDAMREKSERIRKMRFGNVARLYAPIYFSNYCVNGCVYCGFRTSNHFKRRRLSIDETIAEAEVLRKWGMESVLLIAGSDPLTVNLEYMLPVVRRLREMFAYISIELHPQTVDFYRELIKAGVHGMTIYQETYDQETYRKLHPTGPKSVYCNRVVAPENGARAGFYNIGVGALLGLYDWRSEAVSMAAHTLHVRKINWQVRNQVSFPRITPMEGGFEVPHPVSRHDLEQMMLAFRIYFPEIDMFISTREPHAFRMNVIQTCATHISAGSKVNPGGYVESEKQKESADVGQFTVVDDHSVPNVVASLKKINMEPVFKDWDPLFQ